MKTVEQILDDLMDRLGNIYYHRPLMYGGTPEGVDLLIHNLHDIWAIIVERREEFQEQLGVVSEREDCGSANFPYHYFRTHPLSDVDGCVRYTVRCWKEVSERLGLPIPKERMEVEMRKYGGTFNTD